MSALHANTAIVELPFNRWDIPEQNPQIQHSLELGDVLYLPQLAFPLTEKEHELLTPALVSPKRKNISYQPEKQNINGVADASRTEEVQQLVDRYYRCAVSLLGSLLPGYRQALHSPTTSLRLHPIAAWRANTSWRKDDTRLHVDAFPSRPTYGERIVRVFSNINPHGEARVWRVGEDFASLSARFLPELKAYSPFSSWLLAAVGITKRKRSHYDHLMLELHDKMKGSTAYQQRGFQQSIEFPPGSTWICFSDQTPHAAMSGQFMLEQTFLLPLDAMQDPQLSPLRVLENATQQILI